MPARAWQAPPTSNPALLVNNSSQIPVASPLLGSPWSRQDALTLAGVCIAIIATLIALVGVMFPPLKLRKWLCRPFHWITRRLRPSKSKSLLPLSSSSRQPMVIENWKNTDERAARQRLQDHYNESLRVRRGGF
ncbi:hypothetical protein COCMIDRAFT_101387 [Bipolaris oryzae ATCC 44560]|uniref:Uncharacterized protein n=1 Tax=Bipolaris oryzae ATCC 44560 TaxID=930090 RepID=W6Z0M3_COCMI|nr:uncharacterized protein COCMIDRAFT_101387 [Bipolaris oryzae ATCC 44560]EUC43213.1 hypothetical protein COCMIDRAFT_101387 [Bipolaris oryzae ATCC 44560]